MTGEESAGSGIPEGIDPSFLAALPENIRQEVNQEQLRLQRIQERAQQQAQAAASLGAGATEVSFGMHYGPELKKHRINSHLIIHFPMSEGVNKVSERANE